MLKNNIFVKNLSCGITAFLLIFSYSICFAASLQLNIWYALVTAVTSSLISVSLKSRVLAPDTFFTVPLLMILATGTNALMPFCVIGGALIYFAFSKKAEKAELHPAVTGAITINLAFSVTALLTTHYFGIGADGFTVSEILKNYRSLGFHPNWRGVFYGTVTLFAMITYPFKFKKADKYFPAEAFSLILPLILNLWLNPEQEYTPINEIASLADFMKQDAISFFLPSLSTDFHMTVGNYANTFQATIAMGLLLLIFKADKTRKDSETTANIINGIEGGFPVRTYEIRDYSLTSAITSIFLVIFFCFLADDILLRIPLHSLSVVLIVSAWKQVKFKALSDGFRSGAFGIISVIIIFVSSVLTNIFITLIISIILNVLLSYSSGKKAQKNHIQTDLTTEGGDESNG